jgi:hypothetical protein
VCLLAPSQPLRSGSGRASRNRRVCWLAILVVAVAIELTLRHHAVVKVPLILIAGAICARLVVLEARSSKLGPAVIFGAIGLVFVVAVVVPSSASNDLASYAAYGRMVAVHGVSPYDHEPADFPADAASKLVSPRWAHEPSVYGPLFTGISAIETAIAGSSVLAMRLMFQVTAAAAMFATCSVVWWRTRSTAALLFLGLNPIAAVVVNGGHNDALVALALVVAAVLCAEGRDRAGGLALGAAALVKVTALLGLFGILAWLISTRRRGRARRVAFWACGLLALSYAPVGSDALNVLSHANRTITDASAWNPLGIVMLGHQAWRDVAHPLAPNSTLARISLVGTLLVCAVAVFAVWCSRQSSRAERPMGVATASYPLAAPYVFPWYAVWSIPLLAVRRLTRSGWVVWIQSLVVLAALKLPNHPTASIPEAFERFMLTVVAPPALLAAFLVALWYDARADRDHLPIDAKARIGSATA